MFSNKTDEIWEVLWCDDDYEISNYGDIRRIETGRLLRKHMNISNGYEQVSLHGRLYYVHKLVAETFLMNSVITSDMVVTHLDGDTRNNHVDNLKWCTRSEATGHVYSKKRRPLTCKVCKNRYKFDVCYGRDDDFYCGYGQRKED